MVLGALLLAGALSLQLQLRASAPGPTRLAGIGEAGGAVNGTVNPPHGGQTNSAAGTKPVAVVYEMNPWLQVIGADSPSFALYEDGLLIFARPREEGGHEYASAKLGGRELADLVQSLPARQFFGLEPRYETTMATDQPTTVIKLWDGDSLKTVSVYGGLRRTDNDRQEAAPDAFLEVYEKLKGLRPAGAARWTPEKVELMIWPFENAGDPLPWPKGWPDTAHPETRRRGESPGQISYSIYLTPARYEALRKSVSEKSADALLINGRKWAFSFRFPFPAEDSWRKNKG